MKVGVVGWGSIGKRHASNLAGLGYEIKVYDPALRQDAGIRFERDLYDWCDAAVIATPSWVHTGCIRACAERGKHMLVEKPISTSDNGLQELLDLAAKNGAVIMMGNNLRFHACVQEVKTWLRDGYIGKPIWANFTCATLSTKPLYLSDGVILNTGSHEVDLALYLLGPAKLLTACASTTLRPGTGDSDVNPMLRYQEDIADFVLLHESGCRSVFHLDFKTKPEIRLFSIIGADGGMACELPTRSLMRWQADDKLPDITYATKFRGPGSYDADYVDEMRAFIDRIEGKDVPGATGADGLATLGVLLDVRKMAGLA